MENQKPIAKPALPAKNQIRHHLKSGMSEMNHGDVKPKPTASTATIYAYTIPVELCKLPNDASQNYNKSIAFAVAFEEKPGANW